MGNCNTVQCSGDLRLVSASVQVLGFNSVDDQQHQPSKASTLLLHKKLSASLPSLHSPPPSRTSTLRKCPSTDTALTTLSAQPPASEDSTTTTTTTSCVDGDVQQQLTTTTTEIVLASPLPHSRFCKRLRMRRTADWDRVVMPLVTPGARLKVVYNPATLMIHVLERDDSATSTTSSSATNKASLTASGAKAKAR